MKENRSIIIEGVEIIERYYDTGSDVYINDHLTTLTFDEAIKHVEYCYDIKEI